VLFSPSNTGPLFIKNQYLTLHDISFKLFPHFNNGYFSLYYNFLIPKLVRRVRKVFTVSETTQKEISKQYNLPIHKFILTYNGIGEVLLKHSLNKNNPHKEKIILSVGSLSKRKNTELLINSFLVSNLSKEYKLIIIGNRNNIYVYNETMQASNVEFIEHASDELIIDYYQRAELACYISVYEGFGIPVLESLYFGCKVLCSDIPVFRELYQGMVSFTSIQDTESVVNGLNQLPFSVSESSSQLQHCLEKYNYNKSSSIILQTILES
jgi:glycosyltransferase involved in cell wall biosynthesis